MPGGLLHPGQRHGARRWPRDPDRHAAGGRPTRHRHGLPALHPGAQHERGGEPGHCRRQPAGHPELARGTGKARRLHGHPALQNSSGPPGGESGGRGKTEGGTGEAALPETPAADPGRAHLGTHAGRGGRGAGPGEGPGQSQAAHGPHHHPQVPRSAGLCRRRQRAAARAVCRRRQRRRTGRGAHGGNDGRQPHGAGFSSPG